MIYKIYSGNMEKLEKKLKTISNKCKKYGNEFHFDVVGEEFGKAFDGRGHEFTAKYYLVEASGTAKINDWEFAAKVEHHDNGNVVKGYAGIEIPVKYNHTAPICEHCNSLRNRKDTYIVHNVVTGEFKQVGKSCLKDFTNGLSAEHVASYISYFDELIRGEAPYTVGRYDRCYPTRTYLAYVWETVRKFGWHRKDDYADTLSSTCYLAHACAGLCGEWAIRQLSDKQRNQLAEDMESSGFCVDAESYNAVDAMLAWLKEQPQDNNYMANLTVCCGAEYFAFTDIGIVASLVASYNRGMAQRKREEEHEHIAAASSYFAEVGSKVAVAITSAKCVYTFENAYGLSYIYQFTDNDNHLFVWTTAKRLECEAVEWLSGTVKQHKEYKGIKQTVLTRCKVG